MTVIRDKNGQVDSFQTNMAKRQKTEHDGTREEMSNPPSQNQPQSPDTEPSDIVKGVLLSGSRMPDMNVLDFNRELGEYFNTLTVLTSGRNTI